ncbi:MAG: methylenetetrahydrofolate--tRNA-(uracil(54)-C(5))-methyltransferase (FADH(2)-oxidizing) TrmFO [Christensenellales bacterium]|jgi:methylenetetrahydrofolate--tRNA-(uracil-5-)-methyltransferase|nr:methylenetetrahydrofolate--tRNA-(uracil(54)-C(5))-methyltransferase (FADH(2)-oxidizing) TrmFO [Clostridiales bacterium]
MPEVRVQVIGAGLAGCEAAWQLIKRGIPVTLVDMKPTRKTPAHTSDHLAELVCSNSLRGDRLENAPGLLKEELRRLDSLILRAADDTRVPAGGALAVDRERFARTITDTLLSHPLIQFESRVVEAFPEAPFIIATGPLTEAGLADAIRQIAGTLHFYDAAAPIVYADSIDMDIAFRASRYGRGDDYLNCPMNEAEYHAFIDALINAECADIHGFEDKQLFDGCLPIESIAKRGRMAAAFGPMKPVGLPDPRTGKEPFAVVQLRQDDAAGSLYNLVGFQTRLKFPEQKRVFSMIPGLKDAEFARYGVMHRNSFINSPGFLDSTYAVKGQIGQFFAGQITGVEGYVESTASGLSAGIAMAAQLKNLPAPSFPETTAIGALGTYISTPNRNFQPMNINFGILPPLPMRVKGKQNRYGKLAERALIDLEKYQQSRPDLF